MVGVGGRGLVPGWVLSSADATGFALHGESLFLAWPRKSNQKEGHPRHQAPAAPGFPPSFVIPGVRHEGPSMALAALAASMPLDPFHADSARPDEGGMGVVPTSVEEKRRAKSFFKRDASLAGNSPVPFRRPSAGVAEGASRMDAARAVKGHGCPLYGGPRSGAGAREPRRSRGRMSGRAFSLVTFSLRAQRESDSPCKAKSVGRAEESTRLGTKPPRQHPKTPSFSGKESAPDRHQGQGLARSMHRP
ncbi:hypothetical protein HA520_07215 [Azotobacter chroococcum]|uniref:Uncharacterized protein n=1 Tax=Azotobacter chroococcum TaxID=353 RepID=A0AA43Z630_9GAMM|nr:hypothetical protein [Azotobacter chroococcum]